MECTECGARYDSSQNPFCPRCGSLETRSEAVAVAQAERSEPLRRRVQAMGVVLMVFGLIFGASMIFVAFQARPLMEGNMETLGGGVAGGALNVSLRDGDAGVQNASVVIFSLDSKELLNQSTGIDGSVRFPSLEEAAVRVLVSHNNDSWERNVFVLAGGGDVRLTLDTTDASDDASWVGLDTVVTAVRIFAVVGTVCFLLAILGGLAALRLRYHGLATAGAVGLLVPTIGAGVASMNVVAWLIVVLGILALVLIRRGHRFFN